MYNLIFSQDPSPKLSKNHGLCPCLNYVKKKNDELKEGLPCFVKICFDRDGSIE